MSCRLREERTKLVSSTGDGQARTDTQGKGEIEGGQGSTVMNYVVNTHTHIYSEREREREGRRERDKIISLQSTIVQAVHQNHQQAKSGGGGESQ